MPLDAYRQANLDAWNERVAVHRASQMYAADAFVDDAERITGVVEFDAPRVGEVRGKSLLHLQCHFGLDTLSWARLGATVTGLDFSADAIAAARQLSEDSRTPGRFVEAEMYDAPNVVDERFDIVYTGVGALLWLPDIRGWAEVVAGFLAPGGVFYIREGHPLLMALDDERDDTELVVRHPYFCTDEPQRWDTQGSYADAGAQFTHTVSYEWAHSLAEVVQALLDVGLTLVSFEEHQTVEWAYFPWLEPAEGGRFRLPDGVPQVPLMYSLKAISAPASP